MAVVVEGPSGTEIFCAGAPVANIPTAVSNSLMDYFKAAFAGVAVKKIVSTIAKNPPTSRRGFLGFCSAAFLVCYGCAGPESAKHRYFNLPAVIRDTGNAWANFLDLGWVGSPVEKNAIKQGFMDLYGGNDRSFWKIAVGEDGITYGMNHFPPFRGSNGEMQPEFTTLTELIRDKNGNYVKGEKECYIERSGDKYIITTLTYGRKYAKMRFEGNPDKPEYLKFNHGDVANAFNAWRAVRVLDTDAEVGDGKEDIARAMAFKKMAALEEGVSYTITRTDQTTKDPIKYTCMMREKDGVLSYKKDGKPYTTTFYQDTRIDYNRDTRKVYVSMELFDYIKGRPINVGFKIDLDKENNANDLVKMIVESIRSKGEINENYFKNDPNVVGKIYMDGDIFEKGITDDGKIFLTTSQYTIAKAILNEALPRVMLMAKTAKLPLGIKVSGFKHYSDDPVKAIFGTIDDLQKRYEPASEVDIDQLMLEEDLKRLRNARPVSKNDGEKGNPDPYDKRTVVAYASKNKGGRNQPPHNPKRRTFLADAVRKGPRELFRFFIG